MTTAKLTVTGMHCAGCAAGIKATLEALDGVESAAIDYAAGGGNVSYDESKVDMGLIEEKINGLGFGLAEDDAEAEKKN